MKKAILLFSLLLAFGCASNVEKAYDEYVELEKEKRELNFYPNSPDLPKILEISQKQNAVISKLSESEAKELGVLLDKNGYLPDIK